MAVITQVDSLPFGKDAYTVGGYAFSTYIDCNAGSPCVVTLQHEGKQEKLLDYCDRYTDGFTQYGRSYRYIRFVNDKRTAAELRIHDTLHCFGLCKHTDEDVYKHACWISELLRSGSLASCVHNIQLHRIGYANTDMAQRYWKLYDKGELPEGWVGLFFDGKPVAGEKYSRKFKGECGADGSLYYLTVDRDYYDEQEEEANSNNSEGGGVIRQLPEGTKITHVPGAKSFRLEMPSSS